MRYTPAPGELIGVRDSYGKVHRLPIHTVKRYVAKYGPRNQVKTIPILGHEVLDVLLADLKFRIEHKYDNVIIVTGPERSGKSHTAIQVGAGLDRSFTADNIMFDVQGLKDKLLKLSIAPGSAVILDEAGREIYNRNWSKKEQKELVTLFQIFGKLGVTIILVMPRFSYLDSAIRNTRVQYWIDVKAEKRGRDRGYIYVKEAKRNPMTDFVYWQPRYAGKLRPPSDFSHLDEIMETYEAKKDAYIMDALRGDDDEDVSIHTKQRDLMVWYTLSKGIATDRDLEHLLGLRATTIRGIKSNVERAKSTTPELKQSLGIEVEA